MNLALKGYSVTELTGLAGISRQAYYKRLKAKHGCSVLTSKLEQLVKKERGTKSRAGLRAIFHKNNLNGLIGVNRFETQMSEMGYALRPYRSFIKTTDSRGHHHKYDNLIEGMRVNGPNQVVVGDITYYKVGSVFYFLFNFLYSEGRTCVLWEALCPTSKLNRGSPSQFLFWPYIIV